MAERIFAFIDGKNLHLSSQTLGWKVDYARFRIYLQDQYHVTKAYLFLAHNSTNAQLYRDLQQQGFELIFRPEMETYQSKLRGYTETELVLWAMAEGNSYDRAVIVSGDGDLYCLVDYLNKRGKLLRVLVPDYYKYSSHLNRYAGSKLDFLNQLRGKLEYFASSHAA
jgi:uncharacterized LabA/DUF88 family protein